jgi:arylsulfatase A-like enzyme/Flp pilus assembly protein TadD
VGAGLDAKVADPHAKDAGPREHTASLLAEGGCLHAKAGSLQTKAASQRAQGAGLQTKGAALDAKDTTLDAKAAGHHEHTASLPAQGAGLQAKGPALQAQSADPHPARTDPRCEASSRPGASPFRGRDRTETLSDTLPAYPAHPACPQNYQMKRNPMRSRSALSAALAAAAVLAGWLLWTRAPRGTIPPGACRGCSVVLITIDTLRSDRVGAFGGPQGLTPTLDRLAAEGVRLTRAYASAPLTLTSHTSILTATSPPVHGVRTNGLFRLGDRLPTLATVLQSAGYRTGAFVGAFVLDARFGLTRGFDVYDDRYGAHHEGDPGEGAERRAEDVTRPAAAWIHQQPAVGGQPFFAWIHLYDPHAPYRAPEPYASRHAPYDAEVAYTDATVGALLDDLRSAGLLSHTLVVVAADHGESLGEHDEATHGVFVYDVTMRVPWILWAGARMRHAATDAVVRLIDLAPTVLDLIGIAPPADFDGRSVIPVVNGSETTPRSAYVEAMDASLTRNWAPLTGIVSGRNKLIDLPIPELYDLGADPREASNIYASSGERARTLESLLRETSAARRPSGAETVTLGDDARRRLQALGYVGSGSAPGQRVYTDADDPKRLIVVSNALNDAVKAFNAGDRAAAMATVRGITRDHPNFSTAFGELASMERQSGDLRGAVDTLEAVAKRGIADQRVLVVLGGYLMESGNLQRAADIVEAVIAAHPDFADAYNSLGVIEMRRGRHDRARQAFSRVLKLDPTSATAYANLGADDLATGDLTRAVGDLTEAVALDARNYDALYNLAMALDALGRRDEARPLMERFIRDAPPARLARDIAQIRELLDRTKK